MVTPPPLPDSGSDLTEPNSTPPSPLKQSDRWPEACRPDQDCEIGGTVYPAANDLGSDEVLWWIDLTQLKINAVRALVNNVMAAGVGHSSGPVSSW